MAPKKKHQQRERERERYMMLERLTFTRKQSFTNGKINLSNQIILSKIYNRLSIK